MTMSLRHLLAGLLGLALATGAIAREAPAPRPALWQVSDSDTTIYLFGTIHLLPEGTRWRSPAFDKAVGESQQLVVETIVDKKDPTKVMSAMSSLAFSQGLPPLAERVPADKRDELAAAVKKSGFPPAALDRMESWAAAMMLLGAQFVDLGLKVDQGVETVLHEEFTKSGRPVGELETNVEQFGFFDRLPEKAQRALLESTIEPNSEVRSDFNSMLAAWASGDVGKLDKAFNEDLADAPELLDGLLYQRNANWTAWIKRRLEQPGTIIVAVGAGHLAGRKSVVDLLSRDGVKVRRIQ
jgi:uncharacterized protein YbaP (TraB family)